MESSREVALRDENYSPELPVEKDVSERERTTLRHLHTRVICPIRVFLDVLVGNRRSNTVNGL